MTDDKPTNNLNDKSGFSRLSEPCPKEADYPPDKLTGLTMKYFVLTPTKKNKYGKASRDAMLAYAESIRPANPKLSRALVAWVRRILGDY